MTAILTRRSIRSYTSDPVSDQDVEDLIKAAMYAPSAGNQQPWHFVVIRDRAILNEVPKAHPYSKMVPHCRVAILVCADMTLVKHEGSWVQDCSAATQNLLLAAHAKGLGAVWLGVYPYGERVEGIKKLVGLPDHVYPLALVPIGHPAEEVPQPDRLNRTRVHLDRW